MHSLSLFLIHVEKPSNSKNEDWDDESSPDSRNEQNCSAEVGHSSDVSEADGSGGDDNAVDRCEVGVVLDHANFVLVGPFEEPQQVREDEDGKHEGSRDGDAWLVLHEALESESRVRREPVRFAQALRVDVRVLRVVEDGLDQKRDS